MRRRFMSFSEENVSFALISHGDLHAIKHSDIDFRNVRVCLKKERKKEKKISTFFVVPWPSEDVDVERKLLPPRVATLVVGHSHEKKKTRKYHKNREERERKV